LLYFLLLLLLLLLFFYFLLSYFSLFFFFVILFILFFSLEYKLAFNRAKRYNNKIFVNKTGPVFEFKKHELVSSNTEKRKESPKKNMGKTSSALMEEEMHKRKIKEMNSHYNVGYSFGLNTSQNSFLKEIRREQSQKVKRQFDGLFDLENITMKTKYPLLKSNSNTKKYTNGSISDNDNNDNESALSIRDNLQEKKFNIAAIKKSLREKKLLKVTENKNRISNEISQKKEQFYSKIKKESLEDIKNMEKKIFSVTIDNYHSEDNNKIDSKFLRTFQNQNDNLIQSQGQGQSRSPTLKERREQFLNQRYNIENNRLRTLNNNLNFKATEFITPGPGNYCLDIFYLYFFL
jgi:hypothetical protein